MAELKEYVKPKQEMFLPMQKSESDYSWQKDMVGELCAYFERTNINAKIVSVTAGGLVSSFVFLVQSGSALKKIKQELPNIEYFLNIDGAILATEEYHSYQRGVYAGKNAFFDAQADCVIRPFMRVEEQGHFVCLQIPNPTRQALPFSRAFNMPLYMQTPSTSPIFAVGINTDGGHEVCDLAKSSHLLIVGASGSGKSSIVNTMIAGLVCKNSPSDIRFLLVDPKMVEYSIYSGLPHCLTKTPICEPDHAINALNWAVDEMKRRFEAFAKMRTVDITAYNNCESVKSGAATKMPFIIICIDEFAALISWHKKAFEAAVLKLTQKSRAAGIFLVLSTQRAATDTVSTMIRANIAHRMAFYVPSYADSKIALDRSGAEKLLPNGGDMLYMPFGAIEPRRTQTLYITMKENRALIDYLKDNNPAHFDQEIENAIFC